GGGRTGVFPDENCDGRNCGTSHSPGGSAGTTRSLDQVGLPAELTRRAIPPHNPQTPEKIALGEKLFFDGRYYPPTAPWRAVPVTIPRALLPTASLFRSVS